MTNSQNDKSIFGYEALLREKHKQSAVCKECFDTGRIKQKDGTSIFCRCYQEKIWFARFKECGIPESYYDYELSAWDTTCDGNGNELTKPQMKKKQDVKKFIERYIKCLKLLCGTPAQSFTFIRDNEKIKISSLKLVGDNGSGKTMLASLLAISACKKGLTVKYYEWAELVALFSDYNSRDQQNEIVDEFREKHLVIIDNICDVSLNYPYLKLQLNRIAQARVKSGKPILMTFNGNYTEAELNSAWRGLLDSCYAIELPTAHRTNKK